MVPEAVTSFHRQTQRYCVAFVIRVIVVVSVYLPVPMPYLWENSCKDHTLEKHVNI